MNIRKSLAGVAAGSLALAGIAVVSAPAAQAAVTTITSAAPLSCWVGINGASGFIGQVSSTPSTYPNGLAGNTSVTHTLTNASTGAQSASVSVNYSISQGPKNGPAAVTGEVMIVTYEINNNGNVQTFTGSPSAPFNVAGNAYGPPASVSDVIPGSFFANAGATTIKVKNLDFYAAGDFDAALGVVGSTGISTYCNANSANVDGPAPGNGAYDAYPTDNNALTNPITTSITGDPLTVNGPTVAFTDASQGAAGYARANYTGATGPVNGEALVLSGTNWPNSLSSGFSAQITDGAGANPENVLASYSATCSASPTTNPCSIANGGSGATTGTETIQNVYGSTNASGVFTGGIRRLNRDSGLFTTGVRLLKVVNGGSSSSVGITLLGTTTLTLSPANGGPNTVTTLTGSNWNTGRYHYAFAAKDNNYTGGLVAGFSCPTAAPPYSTVCGPYVPVDSPGGALGAPGGVNGTTGGFVSSATGTIPSGVTVTVPSTSLVSAFASAGVEVAQTSSATAVTWPANISGQSKVSAFVVSKDFCTANGADGNTSTNVAEGTDYCTTAQSITATVNPGALTQQANAYAASGYTSTLIPMGAVSTSITAQTLTGNINPITVTDVRGGSAKWSLTASMPNLTESGGAAIENNNMVLGGVNCAPAAGSATGITSGTGGSFATALTICDANSNAANSAGDTVGGQWVANAPLTLTVPAFQKAAAYTSTITFTLT